MNRVSRKREINFLNGTPDKRMYWSIISDYDILSGLCELIDNAIDLWMSTGSMNKLLIDLDLDCERQLIHIEDTSGGVKEEDLRLLIAPGASKNSPESETIGIFGVGSKRAVVALAEVVTIKTRSKGSKSFEIDITKDWLESPDWEIPLYEIPDIEEGVTKIDLSSLRKPISKEDVERLIQHIGETYEWFLKNENCQIKVNGVKIKPLSFEVWAFPTGFEPKHASFCVDLSPHEKVTVEIIAGLIRDRDPIEDNYGVYFYCNHRLVVKELKVREVGYFVASEAGVPHPDASLCRAIVRIQGASKLMPWNSSKSGINFRHPVFQSIHGTLIQLVSHFSSLSRRLKDDWEQKVIKFDSGKVEMIGQTAIQAGKKLVLPPLPKVNKPHFEALKAINKKQIQDQPWTLGLVEAMAAVDIISRQRLETKNRIALLLLDSNFEIALKEFIAHRKDLFPNLNLKKLFENRDDVIDQIATKVAIDEKILAKAKHYYGIRNKFIHERATVDITDTDVENYRETIQIILKILFNLQFD